MAVTNNRLANQALWIGAGFGSMDEATLSYPGQLGMVVIKADVAYQLVQFKSTIGTLASGVPLIWTDTDDFVVSDKASDGKRGRPAGVALGAQTASSYGWIQIFGAHAAVKTDSGSSGAADGDSLIISNTDGYADKVTAGTAPTYAILGIATAAYSAGFTAAYLTPPHNGW